VAPAADPDQVAALAAASNQVGRARSGVPRGQRNDRSGHDAATEQLGEKWAADLKRGDSSNDQLVALIQDKLLNASPQVRNGFRQGFIRAYGVEGASVFAEALNHAKSHHNN